MTQKLKLDDIDLKGLDGFIGKFKAVVVVSYGSGNVNESMYMAIKKAVEHQVRVILVTNCKYGGIYSEYGGIGGNQSLRDLGVIMAEDLSAYQAMVVASLVFGHENPEQDLKVNKIDALFSNKPMNKY